MKSITIYNQINQRYFVWLPSYFINYGSKLKVVRHLPKVVPTKEGIGKTKHTYGVRVFSYFHVCLQFFIRNTFLKKII